MYQCYAIFFAVQIALVIGTIFASQRWLWIVYLFYPVSMILVLIQFVLNPHFQKVPYGSVHLALN